MAKSVKVSEQDQQDQETFKQYIEALKHDENTMQGRNMKAFLAMPQGDQLKTLYALLLSGQVSVNLDQPTPGHAEDDSLADAEEEEGEPLRDKVEPYGSDYDYKGDEQQGGEKL